MRLEDLGAVEGGAQVRSRGVWTFRRAEDGSRGTVGKVRCVLCIVLDEEREIGRWRFFGGSGALMEGGEAFAGGVDGEGRLEGGRLNDKNVIIIEEVEAVLLRYLSLGIGARGGRNGRFFVSATII